MRHFFAGVLVGAVELLRVYERLGLVGGEVSEHNLSLILLIHVFQG
jgi:hypothetical protein